MSKRRKRLPFWVVNKVTQTQLDRAVQLKQQLRISLGTIIHNALDMYLKEEELKLQQIREYEGGNIGPGHSV